MKKRGARRVHKFDKPIAGTTLSELIAKRTQKPEVRRKAQREQAIRAVKDRAMKQQKSSRLLRHSSGRLSAAFRSLLPPVSDWARVAPCVALRASASEVSVLPVYQGISHRLEVCRQIDQT